MTNEIYEKKAKKQSRSKNKKRTNQVQKERTTLDVGRSGDLHSYRSNSIFLLLTAGLSFRISNTHAN